MHLTKQNKTSPFFTVVNNSKEPYYQNAMAIYRSSFPSNEKQKEEVIEQRVNSRQSTMYVGVLEDKVAAMSLLFNLTNSEFVLLDYFAVSDTHRGQGLGTQFMQYLLNAYSTSNKYIVIETEDPAYGDNKIERTKRVNFYRRVGAKT